MNKVVLYLINSSEEVELGFINLDEEITEEVLGDFRYEADVILKDEGIETNAFFRATHETTGQKYDLGTRFTREFMSTADDHSINVTCEAMIEAFFKLALGIKGGTYK